MTRQEQLKYCKICQHKGFNPKQGIICSLTNEIATFENNCENYIIDEQISALENFRKESKIKQVKKKKVKPKKEKEKLQLNDIYLIIGFSFLTIFLLRLIAYAEYFDSSYYYILIIYAFIITSLQIKNKPKKRIRFFHDFKFKIIYSISISILSFIYSIIFLSYHTISDALDISLFILILSLFSSNLSYLIYMPINLLRIKFLKSDD